MNLINEKVCGKIKGRTCAYGSEKKRYPKEGESVLSPMVSLEQLFFTLRIDAQEGCNVAILTVPVHTNMHFFQRIRGY